MTGETTGWAIACGNFAVFALVCAITLTFGGLDAVAMIG
jgi:hypothetical protein